jgi:hypothetical protein
MSVGRKSVLMPFVMAGLLGLVALGAWSFAIVFASSAPAACNGAYSVFAEMPTCRWPAIFVGIGWVAFIAAIASGWVVGARMRRNRKLGDTGPTSGRGAPPHDAHPLI